MKAAGGSAGCWGEALDTGRGRGGAAVPTASAGCGDPEKRQRQVAGRPAGAWGWGWEGCSKAPGGVVRNATAAGCPGPAQGRGHAGSRLPSRSVRRPPGGAVGAGKSGRGR